MNPDAPAPDAGASRCGYIAILGAPNAGKSTLINALVGAKVSIVSPKVQTTRTRLLGIMQQGPAQLIFIDTPGIFAPKRRLERAMVKAAWTGAEEADEVVLLVDAKAAARVGIDADTRRILDGLDRQKRRALLALNKIDLVKREVLLPLAGKFAENPVIERVFMIAGLTGDGLAELTRELAARTPPGPWLFPADEVSDLPARLLAAEVTREQVFLQLHQELPYAILVETESWEELADGGVKISQIIHVERTSQKAIVLGKGGHQIKRIGARARAELASMLDRPVHLFLFVRVSEGWSEESERYRTMGLEFDA
ncbi:MAG TPA: GTPase Era [Stellaceae bacterium]|nr:GTPase Era [Stellaceae bacterium]